jgi:molecular chaperone GrpE
MSDDKGESKKGKDKNAADPQLGAPEAAGGSLVDEIGEARRRELHHLTKKDLEDNVLDLEKRLSEVEAKSREYLDDAQRQKAELENYRKRMVREQTRIIEQANRSLVTALLPVIDNLEKALESSQGRDDGLAEGVRMVYQQLMETLEKEGLEEINPHGHPFDPGVCEAVMAVVSDDHEDETVIEVHQKGYKYKGNLLRPARATVSKCS